jgi:endonuclease YncB( thermonuclease family)
VIISRKDYAGLIFLAFKNPCVMKVVFKVFGLILIVCVSIASLSAADNNPISLTVATKQGLLRGVKEDSICVWRGIEYAKQPVGALRLRAPEAPESWTGIKDAVNIGHVAPQSRRATKELTSQGEDCLSLNIWSPAPDGKKRPVMVWIHGGGFLVGSGVAPVYDGANLSQWGRGGRNYQLPPRSIGLSLLR